VCALSVVVAVVCVEFYGLCNFLFQLCLFCNLFMQMMKQRRDCKVSPIFVFLLFFFYFFEWDMYLCFLSLILLCVVV